MTKKQKAHFAAIKKEISRHEKIFLKALGKKTTKKSQMRKIKDGERLRAWSFGR